MKNIFCDKVTKWVKYGLVIDSRNWDLSGS
jgi:hypothetical protein